MSSPFRKHRNLQNSQNEEWTNENTVPILVEIVSAEINKIGQNNYQSPPRNNDKPISKCVYNTYCVVKDLNSVNPIGREAFTSSSEKEEPTIIHQTKVVKKTHEPVWTILSDSLFIINVQDGDDCEQSLREGKIRCELYNNDPLKVKNKCLGSVVLNKKTLLDGDGTRLEYDLNKHSNYDSLKPAQKGGLRAMGKRLKSGKIIGAALTSEKYKNVAGIIVLRYRVAHPHEVTFIRNKSRPPIEIHANISNGTPFVHGQRSMPSAGATLRRYDISKTKQTQPLIKILPKGVKQVQNLRANVFGKEKAQDLRYNVKPYCDPHFPKETSWMTKVEICRQALEPSYKWIQAGVEHEYEHDHDHYHGHGHGHGDLDKGSSTQRNPTALSECNGSIGQLNIEIIQAQDLPNLDSGTLGNFTDAFVAMVFEDNICRTDIIHDELSPRFMPWCQRAFAFSIQHPSSLLFLGAFDYDAIGDNTPIGRAVLDLSNFRGNTVYLLQYKLHSDPNKHDERGMLTIRLSIEWDSEKKALMKSFSAPPKFRLNVADLKAFRMVRYLCRGKVDMEQANVASIKEYVNELKGYKDSCFLFIDVLARIVLWRGRILVSFHRPAMLCKNSASNKPMKLDLWCPIRSAVVFFSAFIAVKKPTFVPALFFYLIAAAMLSVSYQRSKNPSPWNRCQRVKEIIKTLIGWQEEVRIKIEPYEGYESALVQSELEKARIERVKKVLSALSAFSSRISKERKKGNPYSYLVATEEKHLFKVNMLHFLDSPLSIVHNILGKICSCLRKLRSIANWEAHHYSFAVMVYFIIIGTVFALFPVINVLFWAWKILTICLLGPWMKIVDIYYIIPFYPLPNKAERLEVKEPSFDEFFDSPAFKLMTKKGRLAQEKAFKLIDMREHLFGKYMELVPTLDSSRYPSVPEPSSSARVFPNRDGTQFPTFGYDYLPKSEIECQPLFGQQLEGDMLPLVISKAPVKVKDT